MSEQGIPDKLKAVYDILRRKGKGAYEAAYFVFVSEERTRSEKWLRSLLADPNSSTKEVSRALKFYLLRRDDIEDYVAGQPAGEYERAIGSFYRALAPHYPQYEGELRRLCTLAHTLAPRYDFSSCEDLNEVWVAYEQALEAFVISKPEGKEMIGHLMATKPGGKLPPSEEEESPTVQEISYFEHILKLEARDPYAETYIDAHPFVTGFDNGD